MLPSLEKILDRIDLTQVAIDEIKTLKFPNTPNIDKAIEQGFLKEETIFNLKNSILNIQRVQIGYDYDDKLQIWAEENEELISKASILYVLEETLEYLETHDELEFYLEQYFNGSTTAGKMILELSKTAKEKHLRIIQ